MTYLRYCVVILMPAPQLSLPRCRLMLKLLAHLRIQLVVHVGDGLLSSANCLTFLFLMVASSSHQISPVFDIMVDL